MDWSGCVSPEGVPTLKCIPIVFSNVITAGFLFAGIVALFLIIYSGFKFINSGGDPKQVEGARKTLTFAILGLVVVFLSVFVINVIAGLTGANCITKFGFGC